MFHSPRPPFAPPLAALCSTACPRASRLGARPSLIWIHNVPLRLAGRQSEARGPTSLSHPRCESGRRPLRQPLLKGDARTSAGNRTRTLFSNFEPCVSDRDLYLGRGHTSSENRKAPSCGTWSTVFLS